MANTNIHPSAVVSAESELAEGVEIGPCCVLTGKVRLGEGVKLVASVHLAGPLEIGAGTTLYPGACIGFPPQDYKFKLGDPTAGVRIGRDCILREHVTVHAATRQDVPTTIGDRVFMMASSHAGHDARVGNGVVLVNGVLLAGHTTVFDSAILSGCCGVHQFARVGRMAFVSGLVGVPADIPPFCVTGARGVLSSVNLVGMRRAGFPREHVTAVRNVFWRVLCQRLPRHEMIAALEERGRDCPPVMEMAEFMKGSKRPIARGRRVAPVGEVAE
jgi:UDP-N-acetylglucosamine acyltransferase